MNAGTWLWFACVAAEVGATIAAVRSAKALRRVGRDGATLPILLAFAVASDVAIEAGRRYLLNDSPRPFAGLARAWYHVESTLVLAWPAALAMTAQKSFSLQTRGWWIRPAPSVAWGMLGGLSVACVVAHPIGGSAFAYVLLAQETACIFAAWMAVPIGWERPWQVHHASVIVLICFESIVLAFGPFSGELYGDWPILARVPYIIGFCAIAALNAFGERARRWTAG